MSRSILTTAFLLVCAHPLIAGEMLTVVDEEGQPVEQFQAEFVAGRMTASWRDGKSGKVNIEECPEDEAVNVIVRAAGFASKIEQFQGERKAEYERGVATIVLERGREISLVLHTPKDMPSYAALVPQVYFREFADKSRTMWHTPNRKRARPASLDFNMLNANPDGGGRFTFRYSDRSPEFYVGIFEPGVLRYFEAGPFGQDDVKGGTLEVDVPAAASLLVTFSTDRLHDSVPPFETVTCEVYSRPEAGAGHIYEVTDGAQLLGYGLDFDDLAPGGYLIRTQTFPKGEDPNHPAQGGLEPDPGRLRHGERVTLESGQKRHVDIPWVPYDPLAYQGDHCAEITILSQGGQPAAGRRAKVTYYDGNYGYLVVFEGKVPADGRLVLDGITEQSHEPDFRPYVVSVEDERLGDFRFRGNQPTEQFEFRIVPKAGDPAPNIELLDAMTSQELMLHDLRGKVIVIEFWATWCGPCQPAMAKLNEMGKLATPEWKEQVAIVPISIDEDLRILRTKIQQNGWTAIPQYWASGSEPGRHSLAAKEYAVSGVPTSLIVDREGRIVWRGHPLGGGDGSELEELIQSLLKAGDPVGSVQ